MQVAKVLIVLVLIAGVAGGGFLYWVRAALTRPVEHGKSSEYIVVEKGSTPSQIVAKLAADGILSESMPTLIYLRTVGNPAALKAGEYRFQSPITPLQVLAQLEKGEERRT
ncbi:MAG TPA: endolytic transglycosylase MltG, partial [Candidatus Limnocylindria bacterium]|nr:endolytic transglycosylase MltG [Candidatus Limnocylindria bacterium]